MAAYLKCQQLGFEQTGRVWVDEVGRGGSGSMRSAGEGLLKASSRNNAIKTIFVLVFKFFIIPRLDFRVTI